MLKIKIIYTKYYYSRLASIFKMKGELKNNGIELVNSNEDILMIHTPRALKNEKVIPDKKPFILIERNDSCDIYTPTRTWFVKDNCIGILKNTVLRPIELYNEPFCTGHRYFGSIINNYAQLETPKHHEVILTERDLKKIRCIIPYCVDWNLKFDKLAKLKGIIEKEREFDFHFIGLIEYSQKAALITWHRKRAVAEAEKLKNYKIQLKYSGQRISRKKFLQQLQNTKICLSPWGYGEFSWRDLEAMYCGALVVKPNSEFVASYPNIFQNNITYVPCLPDFSDLEKVVVNILADWDRYTEIRQKARDLLITMWDETKRAKEFASTIIELYEAAKTN